MASAPDPVLAWCEYTQQILGVPWPTAKDLVLVRTKVKVLFSHYPAANYFTLCRLAMWCKGRKMRFARMPFVVDAFRDAWAKGALPELDPRAQDDDLEARIRGALETESRESWRTRLLTTVGNDNRRAALHDWQANAG